MHTIEEMKRWNYSQAQAFFANLSGRPSPETEFYIRSLAHIRTVDLRLEKEARAEIMKSLKQRTLILVDGSSVNGKSTFAERLAKTIKKTEIVDIDIICKDWADEQCRKLNMIEKALFISNFDVLTDMFILAYLEDNVKKRNAGNVILVGSYMSVINRAVIARTLGKYFDRVVSIFCCAKDISDVDMMLEKREPGCPLGLKQQVFNEYKRSNEFIKDDGYKLGFGMATSFIVDNNVSDMFV